MDLLWKNRTCLGASYFLFQKEFDVHESKQKVTKVVFLVRYENKCLFKYTENFTTKEWTFSFKNSDSFHISAQNIDFGYSLEPLRRGGSNEYLQSMFLSRNKKKYVYPCKPQFYYIKVGYKGVNIICFRDGTSCIKSPWEKTYERLNIAMALKQKLKILLIGNQDHWLN